MYPPYKHYMKIIAVLPIALFFYWLLLLRNTFRYKQWALYRTNYDIYLLVQQDHSLRGRLAKLLLDVGEQLGAKGFDWNYLCENISKDSLSSCSVDKYLHDDNLFGYAGLDDMKIEHQQRGLILPVIRTAIEHSRQRDSSELSIVEIGTANGDVLAKLADEFKQGHFVGADFSIRKAQERHGLLKNVHFVKGYALELLQRGELRGNVLFASSTFTFFTPKELGRYLDEIKKAGFSDIVLNEASWGGVEQTNDTRAYSLHLEQGVWFHNWCGYFRKTGYQIADFRFFHYKHEESVRPDIFVTLVWAHI